MIEEKEVVNKLLELNQKINHGLATEQEKSQYVEMLYRNGSITQQQYEQYNAGKNMEDILKMSLIVGGIFLLGYALTKLVK